MPPLERECCVSSTPYASWVSLMVESFFFHHLPWFFSLAKNQTLICFLVSPISKSLSVYLLHKLKRSMIRTLSVLIVWFNVYFFFFLFLHRKLLQRARLNACTPRVSRCSFFLHKPSCGCFKSFSLLMVQRLLFSCRSSPNFRHFFF